jgi:hypothetical protein
MLLWIPGQARNDNENQGRNDPTKAPQLYLPSSASFGIT